MRDGSWGWLGIRRRGERGRRNAASGGNGCARARGLLGGRRRDEWRIDFSVHHDCGVTALATNADFFVSDAFVRDGILGWALSALYVHGVLVEHPHERATFQSTVKAVTLLHRLEHQRKKTQRGAILPSPVSFGTSRGFRPVVGVTWTHFSDEGRQRPLPCRLGALGLGLGLGWNRRVLTSVGAS